MTSCRSSCAQSSSSTLAFSSHSVASATSPSRAPVTSPASIRAQMSVAMGCASFSTELTTHIDAKQIAMQTASTTAIVIASRFIYHATFPGGIAANVCTPPSRS